MNKYGVCKSRKVRLMLKQRVITAIILLVLFLSALFSLPTPGWVVLVIVMVMQGTSEWVRLAKLSGKAAN